KQTVTLSPPTFESLGEQLFIGLAAVRRMGEAPKIPAQWQEFMSGPYQRILNKTELPPVGVNLPRDGDDEFTFTYVCAAQVARFNNTPEGLLEVRAAPA